MLPPVMSGGGGVFALRPQDTRTQFDLGALELALTALRGGTRLDHPCVHMPLLKALRHMRHAHLVHPQELELLKLAEQVYPDAYHSLMDELATWYAQGGGISS